VKLLAPGRQAGRSGVVGEHRVVRAERDTHGVFQRIV
jgi:hypothetical protein